MMQLKQITIPRTFGILILCLFSLTGCASGEKSQEKKIASMQNYAKDLCEAADKNDFVQVYKDLKAIKADKKAKNLGSIARIESLMEETKLLKEGTSKYTAGLTFFCEDLKTYKKIENIPSFEEIRKAQLKAKNSMRNSGSTYRSYQFITPEDYLLQLNGKYPHWMRDTAGPLTGSRSDFGIIDVLYNANSRCTLWIFSSYSNFERFNQVWGNSFKFNYPNSDKFGNTYATENSIYSTTCAMEYSDVYG